MSDPKCSSFDSKKNKINKLKKKIKEYEYSDSDDKENEIEKIKREIISNNEKILLLQQKNSSLEKRLNQLTKNKNEPKDLKNKEDNTSKNNIIELFNKNIKGKKYIKNNISHDGDEGHWLEKNMNLSLNSNNAPDIGGYEMKKDSKKITFGRLVC